MVRLFQQFPEMVALISEKKDGSMRISSFNAEETAKNREKFFIEQGIDPEKVFAALLVHGTKVKVIMSKEPRVLPATDALVSTEKGLFLTITGADCFPVFFYDPTKAAIGVAHAGWRGTVAGIAKEVINKIERMGNDVKDIHVAIGPGICTKHFDIKPENEQLFAQWPFAIGKENGKVCIDLQSVLKHQLLEAGIQENNIETTTLCTFCDSEKFFSYRRDKPQDVEAMVAVIGIQ